jgi:hypothetical protein
MRHPRKLLEDFGWKKAILFQLTFGGGIFVPIMNPIPMNHYTDHYSAPKRFSVHVFLPVTANVHLQSNCGQSCLRSPVPHGMCEEKKILADSHVRRDASVLDADKHRSMEGLGAAYHKALLLGKDRSRRFPHQQNQNYQVTFTTEPIIDSA